MYHSLPCLSMAFLLCLFVISCNPNDNSKEEPAPITSFTDGFFIINKGVAGNVDGSISYYDREREEVVNNIYENKNEESLEGTLEGVYTISDQTYIIQNRIGNISITNTESMELVGAISGFELPRYLLPINASRAYVSQWGTDGNSGSIKIIDLSNNTITGEIVLPPGPERMIISGNDVYVTHTGGFFLDSVVTKINTINNSIVATIPVGISPQSLQVDKDGAIWVLSKGFESFTESRQGTLSKIVGDVVVRSIPVPLGSRDLVIDNNKNTLYFINGLNQKVYAQDISNSTLSLVPFSEIPVTALGFDPVNNLPVGLDAKNFQIEGTLLLLDATGSVRAEYEVSYVPNYLVF